MNDRFNSAEEMRNNMLRHCIDHPHSTTRNMANALNIDLKTIGFAVRSMCERGELQKHGCHKKITYTACKFSTASAIEMRAQTYRKAMEADRSCNGTVKSKSKPKPRSETGRYIDDPEAHPSYGAQEGQGSGRHVFGIRSGMG